jgi:CDP-glycerol glycerophosphotransferase (TagB/SpsB family)
VAYDLMPHVFPDLVQQYFAPFFRYENFDTQQSVAAGFERDRTKDTELYTVGVTYKPHPQVALKLDYRNFELARGQRADDVNAGLGFVF